jgi:hypothetical protein
MASWVFAVAILAWALQATIASQSDAGVQRGRQVLLNGPCQGTIQLKIARADGTADVYQGQVGECVTVRGSFVVGSSAAYCTTSGLWSGPMVEGDGSEVCP